MERKVGGAEGVDGGEQGEDGGLVVSGGAGVDALVAVDGAEGWREGGWDVPLGRGDGLAVVVGVEDDGVRCAGRVDAAVDDGWGAWDFEEARIDAAALEFVDEEAGVAV